MPKIQLKPILIIENLNLVSWKRKSEDIYLNPNGEIFCESFAIKDYTRDRRYKRMYRFSKEYLDKKRREYNISHFYPMTIGDLRELMWHKNIKSISRNRIEEIVHWENQIGNIKNDILELVKKYILNQIYKEVFKNRLTY